MKIRLIQPAQLDENGQPIRYRKLFLPFLTMPTLAGLTPSDVEVGITEDYVEEVDFDEKADLVALTAQTCQAPRAYQIADEFRRRGRKVILGGIHASMCPDEALQHADSVFVGEAEDLWESVLRDVATGTLKQTYRSLRQADLSRLAIPRFDLLNYKNYVVPPLARTPLLPFQTTRGCPNRCDFCAVTAYLGHAIRKKPVPNVIEEIRSANPSRVLFTDDNIVGDPVHAEELFHAMIPLKTRWCCQMSTQILKRPDLIDLAAASGCHETLIGIESVNDRSLESVNKGFNRPELYAELFRRLKQVGILAQGSFVYGFDHDTPETLRRTIDTVLGWDMNYMYIFMLSPLPGTGLYDRMKQACRLLSSDWSQYDAMHPVLRYACLTPDELQSAIWESYDRFYSLGEIARRVWRFRRQYLLFFPRDSAIEEIFFSLHMRRAVAHRTHPFSLGLRRNGRE